LLYTPSFALSHADLSGGNVMLRTAEDCCHGPVTAKVADFGLSRIMDVQSRMQTRMYGTVRIQLCRSPPKGCPARDALPIVPTLSTQGPLGSRLIDESRNLPIDQSVIASGPIAFGGCIDSQMHLAESR